MAPTVGYIDSGELAAVACTLGIAHPTGYPLFTLLGWLFTRIPFGGEEIVRLNIMAGLLCAAGVFVFYHLAALLLSQLAERTGEAGWFGSGQQFATPVAAFGASMILGFSATWWSQAVAIEVYSLNLLLLLTIMYSFLRANASPEKAWWHIFAVALGLGFTNHMTVVLLAPGFLYFYFVVQGGKRDSWLRLARLVPLFLLSLTVYLYLPIRAAQGPPLNWGNPITWERFFWHVGGKQYRGWLFSSTEVAGRSFRDFLTSLPEEFAYVGLFFAVIGCVMLFRMERRTWTWSVLLFVTCVAFAVNYGIYEIVPYFLLAYIVVALWASVGLWCTGIWLVHTRAWSRLAVSGVLCSLSLTPLVVNYSRVDQQSTYDVEDYTMNMFSSLDSNALIFSSQWNFWVSASLYYQLVRGVRPDVTVVDYELLKRSWYLTQLGRTSPALVESSKAEVDAYLQELNKFEQGPPFNPDLQDRLVAMIRAFIRNSSSTRPVYVTSEIEQEFISGYQLVPEGLAFRLVEDNAFHRTPFPRFSQRPILGHGSLATTTKWLYGEAFQARGAYYSRHGELTEAVRSIQEALIQNPGILPAKTQLPGP